VGAIQVKHKPGFRNCVEQEIFRKYEHLKNPFLQNTTILWGLHKEQTILVRYFRFCVEIERKHNYNIYRKCTLNVKNYKRGDDVNI
jgi:hypothetical protein